MVTRWVKHFEKEGSFAVPDWFLPLSTTTAGDGSMGAFVVMIAAVSSSTSSGGAAAGGAAGAAGGGASGAG
jgi:hypothetical protein